jgi:hypothetical protein
MGARKDKRRKLARKVIRDFVNNGDALDYCGTLTDHLTDREFDALVDEIRAAKVTVTWKAGT